MDVTLTSILTGSGLTIVGTLLAPILAQLLPKADAYLKTEGATFGTLVAGEIENKIAPAGLRDFVRTELQKLAASEGANAQTSVTDVVDKILVNAKIQFPGVTAAQIADVVGDFVFAFASGLKS